MFCVYWDSPPGAVLLVDTAGDIGFNLHNPLNPLEPSPTTLDQQVPRPATHNPLHPQQHIFYPIRW